MLEDIIKVILLAIIEGMTEFLPISSTGHLIVGTALLNFEAMGMVFEIFIQIGAVAAVIGYYRQTLSSHAAQLASNYAIRRFWLLIALASLPAAGLGFFFGEQIEAALYSPQVVAIALIAGGIVFLLVERLPRFRQTSANDDNSAQLTDISLRQAVVVGFLQALALIPGTSRSGSSIIGGMLVGLNRRAATEFSFFLALPLLGGATLYKFLTSFNALNAEQLLLLLLGALFSGLFSWLAIDWLLKFISRNSFVIFGYYRIIAGALILLAAAAGLI